jgi:hypothetical protein
VSEDSAIEAGDAIGRLDTNLRKGAFMRTHVAAEPGGDGYTKPIPDILSIIKDSYSELRPAERQVADVVLADVTFAVDASNAEIAKRANVSEPTVTRFCRAIGCDGVRDFKLKLAQSVVVGRLYLAPGEPAAPTTATPSPPSSAASIRPIFSRQPNWSPAHTRWSSSGLAAVPPHWRRKRRTACSAMGL